VLVAVILPTQEAEIRRIQVQSQPRQIVLETLLKKIHYKKRAGGVAQGGEGPEFKLQHTTKKKNTRKVSPRARTDICYVLFLHSIPYLLFHHLT
jgi:hypothetical protein